MSTAGLADGAALAGLGAAFVDVLAAPGELEADAGGAALGSALGGTVSAGSGRAGSGSGTAVLAAGTPSAAAARAGAPLSLPLDAKSPTLATAITASAATAATSRPRDPGAGAARGTLEPCDTGRAVLEPVSGAATVGASGCTLRDWRTRTFTRGASRIGLPTSASYARAMASRIERASG